MRENDEAVMNVSPNRARAVAASRMRESRGSSLCWLLATLALVVAGCGHGHDHDHDHDHDPHGISEVVESAVCGNTEAGDSLPGGSADGASTTPTLPTDGAWFTVESNEGGVARVAFETTVEHGNWRVLVGPGSALTAIEGPHNVDLDLEPVGGACAERFESTALLHIHTPNRWELLFHTEPSRSFALAVMLEFVGH